MMHEIIYLQVVLLSPHARPFLPLEIVWTNIVWQINRFELCIYLFAGEIDIILACACVEIRTTTQRSNRIDMQLYMGLKAMRSEPCKCHTCGKHASKELVICYAQALHKSSIGRGIRNKEVLMSSFVIVRHAWMHACMHAWLGKIAAIMILCFS